MKLYTLTNTEEQDWTFTGKSYARLNKAEDLEAIVPIG